MVWYSDSLDSFSPSGSEKLVYLKYYHGDPRRIKLAHELLESEGRKSGR